MRLPWLEQLEERLLLASVVWNGGGDGVSWTDPLNWSGGTVPRYTDDATIPAGTSVTLSRRLYAAQIHSLVLQGELTIADGSVWVSGDAHIDGVLTLSSGSGSPYLELTGTWHNDGTLRLLRGFVEATGTYSTDDVGNIENVHGDFTFDGQLDNRNRTLVLPDSGGDWHLDGTVLGGQIQAPGDNVDAYYGVFDTVEFDGNLRAWNMAVYHSLCFNGDLTLPESINTNPDSQVTFAGELGDGLSLSGNCNCILQDGMLAFAYDVQLTIGPDVVIRGDGIIGTAYNTFAPGYVPRDPRTSRDAIINKGAIIVDGTYSHIVIDVPQTTNEGILRADDGQLILTGAVTMQGGGSLVATGTGTVTSYSGVRSPTRDPAAWQVPYLTFGDYVDSYNRQVHRSHSLEAMSQDLGFSPEGFAGAFTYGTIEFKPGVAASVTDWYDNSGDASPEALYVNQLILPAGASLDLKGHPLYAKTIVGTGSIFGGPVVTSDNRSPTLADQVFQLPENSPVGTVVGTVIAADPDAGQTLTYSLVSNPYGVFSIDASTGVLSVFKLSQSYYLDFEDTNPVFPFTLQVQVADSGSPPLLARANVTVQVTDANEPPTDIKTFCWTGLWENASVGTKVMCFGTDDPDAGDKYNFTYSLVDGPGSDGNSAFAISDDWLILATTLDYQTKSNYSIRVRSTDKGGLSVEKTFIINVKDCNYPPTDIFLSSAGVDENQPPGAVVGTFSGIDPDPGHNDKLKFSIVSGYGDGGLFAIDQATNSLKTAAVLDYETKPACTIKIRATDPANCYYDKVFTIAVDPKPTDIVLSNGSVSEGLPAGAAVGSLSVINFGLDGQFTYSLIDGPGGDDNAAFAVQGDSLITARPLDYETKAGLSLRVRATAQGGATFERVFAVSVANVNEPPAVSVPGPQPAYCDQDVVFSQATGTAVTVGDVDAAGGLERMTLTATGGVITLGSTAGLADVSGDGSAIVTLTGTIAALNASLEKMKYRLRPDCPEGGIAIELNDLGNSGSGGPMTGAGVISFAVGRWQALNASGKAQYVDQDGDVVTVQLKGGGSGRLHFLGRGQCDAQQIVLFGTTQRSSLGITAKGGRAATTLGGIDTSRFPLAGIVAKSTDFAGSIRIGGTTDPKASVSLALGRVRDARIESELPIKSLSAVEWLDSDAVKDQITAPWISSVAVAGRKAESRRGIVALSGDFQADLILTSPAPPRMVSLGKLTVKGWLGNSGIHAGAGVGQVTVGGMSDCGIYAGSGDSQLAGLPLSLDGFAPAGIAAVTVKGTVKNSSGYSTINSNLAAWSLGRISLSYPDLGNGGNTWGLAGGTPTALTLKLADKNYKYPALPVSSPDSFVVRVL